MKKYTMAYGGWSSAAVGGAFLGFGVPLIIMRMIVEVFGQTGDPILFSNLNLFGLSMIMVGFVLGQLDYMKFILLLKPMRQSLQSNPKSQDLERNSADFVDGVLEIVLPKKSPKKTRKLILK